MQEILKLKLSGVETSQICGNPNAQYEAFMAKVLSLPRSASYRVEEDKFRFRYNTAALAGTASLTIEQVFDIIQEAQRINGLIQGLEGKCAPDVLLVLVNYLRALHSRAMRTCGLHEEPVKKIRIIR